MKREENQMHSRNRSFFEFNNKFSIWADNRIADFVFQHDVQAANDHWTALSMVHRNNFFDQFDFWFWAIWCLYTNIGGRLPPFSYFS